MPMGGGEGGGWGGESVAHCSNQYTNTLQYLSRTVVLHLISGIIEMLITISKVVSSRSLIVCYLLLLSVIKCALKMLSQR